MQINKTFCNEPFPNFIFNSMFPDFLAFYKQWALLFSSPAVTLDAIEPKKEKVYWQHFWFLTIFLPFNTKTNQIMPGFQINAIIIHIFSFN